MVRGSPKGDLMACFNNKEIKEKTIAVKGSLSTRQNHILESAAVSLSLKHRSLLKVPVDPNSHHPGALISHCEPRCQRGDTL